jgi:uncharacterized protein YajQ (UPF0234 family)
LADLKRRLTQKDITLKEMLIISYDYYRKIDNKEWRASVDVVNARLIRRFNFSYNQSKKLWEQTGRETKLLFTVKSDPKSYKKTDSLKFHYYPITVIFKDISRGINSPIKVRCGSLFKPKSIGKKGINTETRKKLVEQDIKNGIEFDFFFHDMWVLHQFNLLYGRDWTNGPPRKVNPNLHPYFCKHLFFVCSKIILPLLSSKRFRLNELWKNE